MSDALKKCLGCFFALLAVAAAVLPVLLARQETEYGYAASGKDRWSVCATGTETNDGIRINSADAAELTALPGVGETIASLIVDERNRNGFYYYAEDLEAVHGIGPKTVDKLRQLIDLTVDESGV